MITFSLLFWIGLKLAAPMWYFGLCVFGFVLNMVRFGCNMFNEGRKIEQEE